MNIRPAGIGDIPQLCDLLADLFSGESDFEPNAIKQARGLELLINETAGKSIILVAESKNGNILGMCSVQTVLSTAEGGLAGILEDVIVRREFRATGIGTSLLTRALDWCKAKGMSRIQLLADKKNATGLRFYLNRRWNETDLICLRMYL